MKVSHAFTLIGVGVCAVGIAATQGCSSGSSTPSGDGGTTARNPPPAKPSGPTTTSTTEHNYALAKLYLGDTDRGGVASQTAWKTYGFDIDHKVTTKDSTDVCTLASGA